MSEHNEKTKLTKTMKISLIAAMSSNRVIGKHGTMPWISKADLLHFKQTTANKTVIMGSSTFFSLNKELTGRVNIVLSRENRNTTPSYNIKKTAKSCSIVLWASSIDDALKMAYGYDTECFVIGGANIYEQFVKQNIIDEYIITLIQGVYFGDTFLPECIQIPHDAKSTEKTEDGKLLTFYKWRR